MYVHLYNSKLQSLILLTREFSLEQVMQYLLQNVTQEVSPAKCYTESTHRTMSHRKYLQKIVTQASIKNNVSRKPL